MEEKARIPFKRERTNLMEDIDIVLENEKLYIVAPLKSPFYPTTTGYINLNQGLEKMLYKGQDYNPPDFSLDKLTFSTRTFLDGLSDWIELNFEVLEAFEKGKITERQFRKLIIGRGRSLSLDKKILLKKSILLSSIKKYFKDIKVNKGYNNSNKRGGLKMTEKTFKRLIIGAVVLAVVVILAIASLTVITPTQRGVKITLGKAGDTVLQPGLVLKTPFVQSVKKYDLSPKTLKMNFSMGQDAAVTSDMQSVACEMMVYWTYDEAKLLEVVNGYTDSSIKSLVESNTLGAIKEVIGKYSIYDIVEKQEEVTAKVDESLKTRLNNYPVTISNITINNWDWAEAFDAQIAETMKMAQQVKVAQQELEVTKQQSQKQVAEANAAKERAEIEAKMKVTVAEQEAIALKTKVQAEADAKVIEAEAEAEARKLEGEAEASYYESLLPYREIIEATRTLDINEIEANGWDGRRVPSYVPLTANGTLVNLN